MDKYNNFFAFIKKASEQFVSLGSKKSLVVTHYDSDGICSAALIISVLKTKFDLDVISGLDEEQLISYAKEDYDAFFFVDIGSSQIDLIEKHLSTKNVFVLDHHATIDYECKNVVHINPLDFGLDNPKEIAAAGVCYYFARNVETKAENLSYLAVVGAIGDYQLNGNTGTLNNDILKNAIESGQIKHYKGLRVYGNKPIHRLLCYSADLYIPGITDPNQAVKFLNEIDIDTKCNGDFRRYKDLSDKEKADLEKAIIEKRKETNEPTDIYGDHYILTNAAEDYSDIYEFSTLLNACGRTRNGSVGVGICLGEKDAYKKGCKVLFQYRIDISNSLKWFNSNKDSAARSDRYLIINAEKNIKPSIIGIVASILARSNMVESGKIIIAIAEAINYAKVSVRMSGEDSSIDLRKMLSEIVEKVGGVSGGHSTAAGARIPVDKVEEFIEFCKEKLK
jgi:RecJ-like exonuclease